MSERKVPRSVEQRIVIKFLVGENVPSAEIHHRPQQQYGEECLLRRHSSPYCCWGAACLHTNQSRSYLNHLVLAGQKGAKNDLLVRQCTFVHAAAYCHTRDATQRTPLSCIACMTICCSVHKSALTYKESETYTHVGLREGGPVFRAPTCTCSAVSFTATYLQT